MDLPAGPLKTNRGTWSVPCGHLPAIALAMQALPREEFDPLFAGQHLTTTYLDAPDWSLLKARREGERYCTLRVRRYASPATGLEGFALSAKTETEKFRREIAPELASQLLTGATVPAYADLLPADLVARLQELAGDQVLRPIVATRCHRYATESSDDRLTLDVGITADVGRSLENAILEHKATDMGEWDPGRLPHNTRPIKMSKILWATSY